MARLRPRITSLAVWVASTLATPTVHAACPAPGPVDLARVEAAVNAGRAAHEEGRLDRAIEHYAAAVLHIDWSDPGWSTVGLTILWSLAELSAELQRYDQARDGYRCFLSRPERDPERSAEAWSRIEHLNRQQDRVAPWLVVSSAPLGAAVTIDGADVGPTPWRGRTTPGRHHLAVVHPERVPVERTLEVRAGVPNEVSLTLVEYARLRIEAADGRWRVRIGDRAPAPLPVERRLAPGAWTVTFEHADTGPRPPWTLELASGEIRTLAPPRIIDDRASTTLLYAAGGLGAAGAALAIIAATRHAEADRIRSEGGADGAFSDAIDQGNALYVSAAVAGGLAIAAGLTGWALRPDPPTGAASTVGWTLGRF